MMQDRHVYQALIPMWLQLCFICPADIHIYAIDRQMDITYLLGVDITLSANLLSNEVNVLCSSVFCENFNCTLQTAKYEIST